MDKMISLLKRPKPKIFEIEHSDIALNSQMFDLVSKLEANLSKLAVVLKDNDVAGKNAKLAELENNFLSLKSKVDTLLGDVRKIMSIEVQNKDFILVNDDAFLRDKQERLVRMSEVLDELLELFSERPAASELKADILQSMYQRIDVLVDSINNIVNDDKSLENTYSKIELL